MRSDGDSELRDRVVVEQERRNLVRTFDNLVDANLALVQSVTKLVSSVNQLLRAMYVHLLLNTAMIVAVGILVWLVWRKV